MRHGAAGGVGGGLSRSDKTEGRVSSGGGGGGREEWPHKMAPRPLLSIFGCVVDVKCCILEMTREEFRLMSS